MMDSIQNKKKKLYTLTCVCAYIIWILIYDFCCWYQLLVIVVVLLTEEAHDIQYIHIYYIIYHGLQLITTGPPET